MDDESIPLGLANASGYEIHSLALRACISQAHLVQLQYVTAGYTGQNTRPLAEAVGWPSPAGSLVWRPWTTSHALSGRPRAITVALKESCGRSTSRQGRQDKSARPARETTGPLSMKLIIAIIQPNRLEAVKAALTDVEVFRLTVMDCQGFGRQKGQTEVYRGHEFAVNLLRKVQLQIAVNEPFVEPTIAAIIKGGKSGEKGEIGDGKIFVLPLDDCIRIRTGERGSDAI